MFRHHPFKSGSHLHTHASNTALLKGKAERTWIVQHAGEDALGKPYCPFPVSEVATRSLERDLLQGHPVTEQEGMASN